MARPAFDMVLMVLNTNPHITATHVKRSLHSIHRALYFQAILVVHSFLYRTFDTDTDMHVTRRLVLESVYVVSTEPSIFRQF